MVIRVMGSYIRAEKGVASHTIEKRTQYNTVILDLFQHDPKTTIIVATIAFGMGINLQMILDMCNFGVPDSLNADMQQHRHAG